MTTIIRLILTAGLCYLIYTEAGIFTATGFALVAIAFEMAGFIVRSRRSS